MSRQKRRPVLGASPKHRAYDPQKLPRQGAKHPVDLSDPDPEPPEEPGVSVEPAEVGVQFLRDATEQYNFESTLRREVDPESARTRVSQVISEGTLDAAGQDDFDMPLSHALDDEEPEIMDEADEAEVDLTGDSIVEASLFDHPADYDELDEDEDAAEDMAEDELEATLAAPLRSPHVRSDDPSDIDENKRQAMKAQFDERVRKRLHAHRLPDDGAE